MFIGDIYRRILTMTNLVSLLVAAALVSSQYGLEANAQIDTSKAKLDNSLQPNVATPVRRIRRLKKFVHISQPPPETVRLMPGSRIEIDCEVMGNPAPTVQWLKNQLPIDHYDDDNEILSHPMGLARLTSKLIITAASNGDEYTCLATAGVKHDTATTTVYSDEGVPEEDMLTLQNLFLEPSKPVITLFYSEIFQDIGTDLILPCRVHSFPKSQVFWQDRNDNLIYGNSRMRVLPSGDLLVTDLRWSDMGNFTCTAKNMYGADSVATFTYPTRVE